MTDDCLCECGSEIMMSVCCGPYLDGQRYPITAEALMRSRYCAFVTGNSDYLIKTWSATQRPKEVQFDDCRWLGLKIQSVRLGGEHDTEGWVSFVARYKIDGKAHRLEENSYFCRENGRWVYCRAEDINFR